MSRPRRRGRDVHGVLLLDKPQGASSNDVLQKVKRIYNANRAGHTGALDPLATGMLPICLGEATKFSQYLLDSDKRYRVIAKLGQRTDTSDADGLVVEERPVTFSAEQLDAALDSFRGDTLQVPSMYSALKYQGKKLYEYARQGIEVPREARPITVYELLFIRHEGDELELEVHCSKGTYIRTIIDDLGEKLGCGAHVIYLRRLAVSKYPVERMVTLEHLQKELVELLSETLRINDNMLNHWYRSQNRMLSPTERAILRYMSCGYSIPEIAAQLERNIKTIRAHKFNAMVKLGVNSDVGLLDAADIITHLPAREPQCLALITPTFL